MAEDLCAVDTHPVERRMREDIDVIPEVRVSIECNKLEILEEKFTKTTFA